VPVTPAALAGVVGDDMTYTPYEMKIILQHHFPKATSKDIIAMIDEWRLLMDPEVHDKAFDFYRQLEALPCGKQLEQRIKT